MKEKQITVFVPDDDENKEFRTREECLQHEKREALCKVVNEFLCYGAEVTDYDGLINALLKHIGA